MNRNKVVLVDEQDRILGEMDKLEAHQKGILHRAFSIFIFNHFGEMLLQQRAVHKYHGANLWTNACCSHPQINEDIKESALERLQFEMGFSCDIKESFSFIYNAPVENHLIENEFDHVFIGFSNEEPLPNSSEVKDYKWAKPEDILIDIQIQPHKYTYWFKHALEKVLFNHQSMISHKKSLL